MQFFYIDEDYLNYLRTFDSRVPVNVEDGNKKFFVGVILEIDGYKYYAPISSFKKQQKTNFIIEDNDEDETPLASVRLSFMVPCNDALITLVDIESLESTYKNLCQKESMFCRKHKEEILALAKKVHTWGNNRTHYLSNNICHFKLLEAKMDEYR